MDIICTVTPAIEPIIKSEWIAPGTHINAVGSCSPSARELDSKLVAKSKIFTDKRDSLFNEAGDFIIPLKSGLIDETHLKGEIGEINAALQDTLWMRM